MRALTQDRVPLVLDADGLNALATMPEANKDLRATAVFTPHPGEWKRLADAFTLDGDPTGSNEQQRAAAQSLARRFGCVVALKTHDTVVTDGVRDFTLSDANRWTVLQDDEPLPAAGPEPPSGYTVPPVELNDNPQLATGGSGDVLTGVIAGIIAQHVKPALLAGERSLPSERRGGVSVFDATRAAVVAHAYNAWTLKEWHNATGGIIARDLLEWIPSSIQKLRHS